MKTNKLMKNGRLALTMGLLVTASLPVVAVLGLTGCAGDKYNRSTGEYIDDDGLKMRINSALSDNPDYKFKDVTVTVFKGNVQLSGFVDLSEQQDKAGDIAQHVQGVRYLVNSITVRKDVKRTDGQYVDDKELVSKIKDSLNNSPEYKLDGVSVAAFNGTVQLSGLVNTPDQKDKAGDIAKNTAGVNDVVNAILVKEKLNE